MKVVPRYHASAPELHCHVLIRSVAIEMAAELYAEAMRDNSIYEGWKAVCPELDPILAEVKFIELLWPLLVRNGSARATLARALTSESLDEAAKYVIYDALVADAGLTHGRRTKRRVTHSTVRTN